MPDEITLASTTASQEEIDAAVGVQNEPTTEEKPEVKAGEEPVKPQKETEESRPKPHSKGGKSPQARIDQLTKEKYELRERLARLEAAQEAKATKSEPAKLEAEAKPRPKPVKDDPKYKTYEDFAEDLAGWTAEQRIAADRAAEAEKQRNERLREKFDNFNAQITEARKKYDDWDDIAKNAASFQVPKVVDAVIPDFPNGADVLYYIATHEDFRQKLLDMNDGFSDNKIFHELSRLSDYLAEAPEKDSEKAETPAEKPSAPAPKPTPVSSAPAPIKPVGGGSSVTATRPLDELPYQEYKRARAKGAR